MLMHLSRHSIPLTAFLTFLKMQQAIEEVEMRSNTKRKKKEEEDEMSRSNTSSKIRREKTYH